MLQTCLPPWEGFTQCIFATLHIQHTTHNTYNTDNTYNTYQIQHVQHTHTQYTTPQHTTTHNTTPHNTTQQSQEIHYTYDTHYTPNTTIPPCFRSILSGATKFISSETRKFTYAREFFQQFHLHVCHMFAVITITAFFTAEKMKAIKPSIFSISNLCCTTVIFSHKKLISRIIRFITFVKFH